MLTFDEKYHLYRWNGTPVPSVTQILDANGYISDFCKSDTHANRGTEIHEMISLYIRGKQNSNRFKELHETYDVEYKQWCDFLSATGYRPLRTEIMTHGSTTFVDGSSVGSNYMPDWAGTTDVILVTPSGEDVVLDIKTGSNFPPHTFLQLAAYAIGEFPLNYDDVLRFGLRLTDKRAKFKLQPYKDQGDFELWIKEIQRYKRNNQN